MLISRRTFPPQGFWWYEPQTNWPPMDQAPRFFAGMTFDQVVDKIIEHRLANPRFNLATDRETVGNQLDKFTCLRIGNNPNYCLGGPVPKSPSPLPVVAAGKNVAAAVVEKVRKYTQGIAVLLDWLGTGAKTVPQEQADRRAGVCVTCAKNIPGDWESYFTTMAAEKIRKQLEVRKEMAIRTAPDDRLSICEACRCVLKLKVWVPIETAARKLTPEMRAELDPKCWILEEDHARQHSAPSA